VLRIKEDTSSPYTLTNGQKCNIYLQLLLTENTADKVKWFKINQISNVEITEQEFQKFRYFRDYYKMDQVNLEMVELKA
jgi:hypothetical protein